MAQTIAVIGGSGLYQLDEDLKSESVTVETPFGSPSGAIQRVVIGDSEVLFLPRHGPGHTLLPSEVNYRANIWALKSLGATWCLGVGAVGSLQEEVKPGDFVLCDQFIDRTKQRAASFFGDGIVAHVQFADPVCPSFTKFISEGLGKLSDSLTGDVHQKGTYLCMEGPAFSTRAESSFYRTIGASVIGMTSLTEAKLAREAELAYACLCLVTDYDCWRSSDSDVDVTEIIETLGRSTSSAKRVIKYIAEEIADLKPSEMASRALETAIISNPELVPPETMERLKPILKRVMNS